MSRRRKGESRAAARERLGAPVPNKPDGYDVLLLKVAQLEEQMKNEVLCQDSGHAGRLNKMEHRWTGMLWLWTALVIAGPALMYVSQIAIAGEIRALKQDVLREVRQR